MEGYVTVLPWPSTLTSSPLNPTLTLTLTQTLILTLTHTLTLTPGAWSDPIVG